METDIESTSAENALPEALSIEFAIKEDSPTEALATKVESTVKVDLPVEALATEIIAIAIKSSLAC